jgi:hypothetical protein
MPIFDYTCSFCQRSFSQKSNLVTHINAIHSSEFEEHHAQFLKTSDSPELDSPTQDENATSSDEEKENVRHTPQEKFNEEEWRTLREIGNIMLALTEDPDVSFMARRKQALAECKNTNV